MVQCVDVRPVFIAMQKNGMLDEKTLFSTRDSMKNTIDTMGSSLVKTTGIAYAIACDKAAGVDVDKIQKTYLVYAGLKMVGMALLMGVVTVLVGFFASKVAAGIGMTLPEKMCSKKSLDFPMQKWIVSQRLPLLREVRMIFNRFKGIGNGFLG